MEIMQLNVKHWSSWMIAIGSLRKYHMMEYHMQRSENYW